MKELRVKILEHKEIAPEVYALDFELPESIEFRCGQFVNLSVGDGAHLLRRIHLHAGQLQALYRQRAVSADQGHLLSGPAIKMVKCAI